MSHLSLVNAAWEVLLFDLLSNYYILLIYSKLSHSSFEQLINSSELQLIMLHDLLTFP
jgi:hypothetical protein